MLPTPTRTDLPDPTPFRSIGIVGLGVMGGSLAQALRRQDEDCDVVGWDHDPSDLEAAVNSGAISRQAASLEDAVATVELLVLAVPVQATCGLLGRLAPLLESDTVVHDVASLKAPVQAAVTEHGLQSRWVGGHPMCGSQASGFGAARPDLYDDARIWIVASEGAEAGARRVDSLWRSLGAHPQRTEAPAHDALMGLVSHLPQLTSNLLGQVLAEAGVSVADLGPGGRDATRLAGSSPDMWIAILEHAPKALPAALRRLGEEAARLADELEGEGLDGVRELMERSRAWRERP